MRPLLWAKEFNPELSDFITRDRAKFESIINIEREQEKPRKDYEKFSDVPEKIRFFYPDKFDTLLTSVPFTVLTIHS
jgi:hypothetical protein